MQQAVTMLVSYFPKAGKEKELLALIEKHWPTLLRVGLATDMPAKVWRARDKRSGRVYFVELFQWKDESSSDAAHTSPEVRAIWNPMEAVLDEMQLAVIEPVSTASVN